MLAVIGKVRTWLVETIVSCTGQLAAVLHGFVGPRRDDPQNESYNDEPESVELKNAA